MAFCIRGFWYRKKQGSKTKNRQLLLTIPFSFKDSRGKGFTLALKKIPMRQLCSSALRCIPTHLAVPRNKAKLECLLLSLAVLGIANHFRARKRSAIIGKSPETCFHKLCMKAFQPGKKMHAEGLSTETRL